ncbi:hypothetical protein [Streptomyces sp. H27-D2]|uniref:hypothetical protein n=1 Tax=Streptomyces sp. H27-D2 TaxID=3046304 RepID=UPI002DBAE886|nr:hypothetical protein [Streptomyces sp. H27-D2]MEC4016883.1 hypothetical protein [Streptomyces sp. H27-D2]
MLIRALAAAAAAAAVTGSVLLRTWDRTAGKRVAELTAARVRDEWKTDERIAELEVDLEDSRRLRTALDTKVRGKRAELGKLRGEHAALLRRYATAETERATALEGRRLLAIEAAAPARALPAAIPDRPNGAPTPHLYRQAAEALRHLGRNAGRQEVRRTVAAARGWDGEKPAGKPEAAAELAARQGHARTAAVQVAGREHRTVPPGASAPTAAVPTGSAPTPSATEASALVTSARVAPAPTADAEAASAAPVTPYARQNRAGVRTMGGFDFFGTQLPYPQDQQAPPIVLADERADERAEGRERDERSPLSPQLARIPRQSDEALIGEDLADVVGPEVLAERESEQTAEHPAEPDVELGADPESEHEAEHEAEHESTSPAAGAVIDLTAHDETEQIDVAELRSAIS